MCDACGAEVRVYTAVSSDVLVDARFTGTWKRVHECDPAAIARQRARNAAAESAWPT